MLQLILLLALAVQHTVLITWDKSTSDTGDADTKGVYKVYKAPLQADGTCGAFKQLAVVSGQAFLDVNVVVDACYQTTFQLLGTGAESVPYDAAVTDLGGAVVLPQAPILKGVIN